MRKPGGSNSKRLALKLAVALLILGVILIPIIEIFGRNMIRDIAADGLRSELKIPESQPVDVEIRGSVTWQLLTGSFRNVAINVPDYQVADGIVATASANVGSVALSPTSKPLKDTLVYATMTQQQFSQVLETLASEWVDGASLETGAVVVKKTFSAFGQSVPASVEVQVEAPGGKHVRLKPVEISAGGITATPEKLTKVAGGSLAEIAKAFVAPLEICIADYLPKGLDLQQVEVTDGKVRAAFKVAPEFLRDATLQKPAACEQEETN